MNGDVGNVDFILNIRDRKVMMVISIVYVELHSLGFYLQFGFLQIPESLALTLPSILELNTDKSFWGPYPRGASFYEN